MALSRHGAISPEDHTIQSSRWRNVTLVTVARLTVCHARTRAKHERGSQRDHSVLWIAEKDAARSSHLHGSGRARQQPGPGQTERVQTVPGLNEDALVPSGNHWTLMLVSVSICTSSVPPGPAFNGNPVRERVNV